MMKKFVAAFIIGAITACIGPFYYCRKLREHCAFQLVQGKKERIFNKSESFESQSPLVHIKILHPYRGRCTNATTSDASDNTRNSIDSKEVKETMQVAHKMEPVFSEEPQIVPLKTVRNKRRISRKMWSSALRGQLDRIKSSSTELCGNARVVRAQVEAHPRFASSNETSTTLCYSHGNSSRLASSHSQLSDEKARKLSTGAVKKWKSLKRTLICSRSEKSTLHKETDIDENQRLNVPSSTHSSLRYSAMLKKNRLVDVSTSTRLSANVGDAQNDEIVTRNGNSDKNTEVCRTSRESENETRQSSSTVALQEIVSLMKRQSVDGTSICDVKISGLTMNQADLINLFEATKNDGQPPSIVSTEEASIISIRFHRERNSNESSTATSYYECPLRRFYRRLPEIFEDLSFSGLFKSLELQEKPHRATPTIQISEHSDIMNNSKNETSYIALPKCQNGLMADESVFSRERTLSRRFNPNSTSPMVNSNFVPYK